MSNEFTYFTITGVLLRQQVEEKKTKSVCFEKIQNRGCKLITQSIKLLFFYLLQLMEQIW